MDIREWHLEPMNSDEWIRFFSNNSFSPEELCWLYCCGVVWKGLLIDYENLPAVTKAVLDNGMDPNQLVSDEGPAKNLEETYFETPLICATRIEDDYDLAAAASLKLLLEHGGDPNTVYIFDSTCENVFEFYVEEDFVHGPDLPGAAFYGLILCAAYGGKYRNGHMPFTMLIDAPISIFKDYELYWYEYVKTENNQEILYIIEKAFGRRVARLH